MQKTLLLLLASAGIIPSFSSGMKNEGDEKKYQMPNALGVYRKIIDGNRGYESFVGVSRLHGVLEDKALTACQLSAALQYAQRIYCDNEGREKCLANQKELGKIAAILLDNDFEGLNTIRMECPLEKTPLPHPAPKSGSRSYSCEALLGASRMIAGDKSLAILSAFEKECRWNKEMHRFFER